MKGKITSPIIIIGMHRSGTSLVSDLLHDSGIWMGTFQDHNKESLTFLNLNNQMLTCMNADWDNPIPIEASCFPNLSAQELYLDHFKLPGMSSLNLKLRHQNDWGWKDPRNTFTLKAWLSIFPEAKVIHVVRNGKDVAQSLLNRTTKKWEVKSNRINSIEDAIALWAAYVEEGIKYRQLGDRYLEVKYEDLVSGNRDALKKLSNFTGRPHPAKAVEKKVRKRHHEKSTKAKLDHPLMNLLGY